MARPLAHFAAGILIALAGGLAAQAASILPGDGRETLKIGVAAFSSENLDPIQESFASSFPLRLRESLGEIRTRSLDAEELAAYRSWARAKALFAEGRSIQESRYSIDQASFSGSASPAANAAALEKKMDDAIARLAYIASVEEGLIPAAEERTLSWKDGQSGQALIEPVVGDPLIAAARQDLDILLYGSLIGFEDYLAVDVVLYGRFLGKPLLRWQTAFAQDDASAALEEIISALRDALAGKPTGILRISVEPRDTDIFMNSAYVGRGDSILYGLPVGKSVFEFEAEGMKGKKVEIEVQASVSGELSVILDPEGEGTVSIRSSSGESSLYVDAMKAGTTPLELDATGVSHVLSIRDPDGAKALALESLEPGLAIDFNPRIPKEEEGFLAQRDKFYTSFGWFMASLPLAVLSNGLASLYEARSAAHPESASDIAATLNLWKAGAAATTGLSTGLFGFSVWRFTRYLSSTRRM